MEWICLAIVCILLIVSCILGYSASFRNSEYYYPISFIIGTTLNAGWYWSVRYLDDNKKIYVYSVIWDAVIVAVFYLVPLFICGVQINRWGFLGLALIVAGLVLLKMQH